MLKNLMHRILLLILLVIVGIFTFQILCGDRYLTVAAQNSSPSPVVEKSPLANSDNKTYNAPPEIQVFKRIEDNSYLSDREFILSLLVICLTCAFLIMKSILLLKARSYKPEHILPGFAVIFIIGGSLFLISAGYSATQIAPVLGLFGTIAGYLIGKEQGSKENEKSIPKDGTSAQPSDKSQNKEITRNE